MEYARIEIDGAKPAAGRWAGAARTSFPALFLISLIAELALAERKFAIFGGGFGQSQALDAPLEIGAFAAGLLLTHFLLVLALFHAIRLLHGHAAERPLFYFNFFFLGAALLLGVLIAKYQALSYFSDAISFQIIRNLGGGSVGDALLYVLHEGALLMIVTVGALLLYAGGLWLSGLHRLRGRIIAGPRPGWIGMLALAALTPFALLAVNQVADARAALDRFHGYALLNGTLHRVTDFDGDGFSFFSYPIDSHPFDAERHPYAVDIADLDMPAPLAPAVFSEDKPHVILIVLESARGDLLGKRVNGRPVAPVLEAMARAGSWAPEAYSHVGFTSYSMKSLFTGKLAPIDDRQTLLRDFKQAGYQVAVMSSYNEEFGGISETAGMRANADIFVDALDVKDERAFGFATPASLVVDGRTVLREFNRHLGSPEAWARPTFLYINLQSAHFPYYMRGMDQPLGGEPIPRSRISRENRAWLEHTYWNAIAYNDLLIGELLAQLETLGIADDALIMVTADHGESLFHDGFLGHGHMLNREQTHIPLILSRPGLDLGGPIGLADMRQILLAAAGADIAPRRRGPVFQYLGYLDRPGRIGIVEEGGHWTTIDLRIREVHSSATGERRKLADLPPGDPLRMKAEEIIREWARQRRIAEGY